jgi:NADH:ubiquinone oxidoreductase subunit C
MEVERLADSSVIIDRSVKSWLQEHSSEQREQFVEALYTLFTSSQATTFSELAEQWKKNPAKVLSCLLAVDSQTRKNVIHAMYELFRATHQEIKLDVKNWLQERIQEKIAPPAVISDDS